jgi:hypothetical protein
MKLNKCTTIGHFPYFDFRVASSYFENTLCSFKLLKLFKFRNTIQHSQLRLGSWNWLDLRRGEKIRKRNTFLKATLVISFICIG